MNAKFDLPVRLLKNTIAASLLLSALASQASAASFDVFAKENSIAYNSQDAAPLDTGLVFSMGDSLNITATGTWNGGACGDLGPNGSNCFGEWMPGINYYTLVGRVGAGNYFLVGSGFAGTATSSGHLFLAFVDSDSFNNSGFVTATVSAVPEPASYALLMGGLGVLSLMARRRRG